MKSRMINTWDRLLSSFLFLPLLIIVVSIVLGFLIPHLEQWFGTERSWLGMTPDASQTLLAAIATAMMTVASLVFSITIVTLSIATSQLGPRLLRTYTSMRSTQVALGLFVGTGVYAILVLMAVHAGYEGGFVPQIAVLLGVLLTLLSLTYLVYFVDRIAYLIQAPNAAQAVGAELDDAVERLYPECSSAPGDELSQEDVQQKLDSMGDNCRDVPSLKEGYLESVDLQELMRLATEHDLILLLYYQMGQFVLKGAPLVKMWPAKRGVEDLDVQLNQPFLMVNRPTPRQDLESSINELVELALRALSPNLNDPFTAINCIDRLTASLTRLAEREIPSPYRLDQDGNLRVIAQAVDFCGALAAAFDEIRRSAEGSVWVQIRLLESLALIGKFTHREQDRAGIKRHADMIREAAERAIAEPNDLEEMRKRHATVEDALRQAAQAQQAKTDEREKTSSAKDRK